MIGFISWLIANREPRELFDGVVGMAAMFFPLSLIVALIMGLVGRTEGSSEISQFLATRPISTTDFARVILETVGGSVLLAWLIWMTAFAIVYVSLDIFGSSEVLVLPKEISWWFFPAVLLGMWTAVAVGATIGLAGRGALFFKCTSAGIAVFIGYLLLKAFLLSRETASRTDRILLAFGGVLILLGTAWAFVAARRRGMVSTSTAWASLCIWATIIATVIYNRPTMPLTQLPSFVLIFGGLTALVVAPFAAAPLALAWNRHR